MKYLAHIVDGLVVNVSLWDGKKSFQTSEEVVEIPVVEYFEEGIKKPFFRPVAGIGWNYIDGEFIDNRPVENGLEG